VCGGATRGKHALNAPNGLEPKKGPRLVRIGATLQEVHSAPLPAVLDPPPPAAAGTEAWD
jgi:hypothetical protein